MNRLLLLFVVVSFSFCTLANDDIGDGTEGGKRTRDGIFLVDNKGNLYSLSESSEGLNLTLEELSILDELRNTPRGVTVSPWGVTQVAAGNQVKIYLSPETGFSNAGINTEHIEDQLHSAVVDGSGYYYLVSQLTGAVRLRAVMGAAGMNINVSGVDAKILPFRLNKVFPALDGRGVWAFDTNGRLGGLFMNQSNVGFKEKASDLTIGGVHFQSFKPGLKNVVFGATGEETHRVVVLFDTDQHFGIMELVGGTFRLQAMPLREPFYSGEHVQIFSTFEAGAVDRIREAVEQNQARAKEASGGTDHCGGDMAGGD